MFHIGIHTHGFAPALKSSRVETNWLPNVIGHHGGRGVRWLVLLGGWWATVLMTAPVPLREYQLNAVFLYHFTQFVEWPATAFPDVMENNRVRMRINLGAANLAGLVIGSKLLRPSVIVKGKGH